MFTFKYNIYCNKKVRNKFLVDKLIVNENFDLIKIDKVYMNKNQIFKLLKYINLNNLQII